MTDCVRTIQVGDYCVRIDENGDRERIYLDTPALPDEYCFFSLQPTPNFDPQLIQDKTPAQNIWYKIGTNITTAGVKFQGPSFSNEISSTNMNCNCCEIAITQSGNYFFHVNITFKTGQTGHLNWLGIGKNSETPLTLCAATDNGDWNMLTGSCILAITTSDCVCIYLRQRGFPPVPYQIATMNLTTLLK